MILERRIKGRKQRALHLVQLQSQSIKVVGLLNILETIIIGKAKMITGDPLLPQEIENRGTPIRMVIMHQVLIPLEIRERSISMIRHPMGRININSIGIQHPDLVITVMIMVVAREETTIGGRSFYLIWDCSIRS